MVKNAYILNPLSNKITEFYMAFIVVWRWAARVPVIYGNQHGMPFQGEWVCGKELHTYHGGSAHGNVLPDGL